MIKKNVPQTAKISKQEQISLESPSQLGLAGEHFLASWSLNAFDFVLIVIQWKSVSLKKNFWTFRIFTRIVKTT